MTALLFLLNLACTLKEIPADTGTDDTGSSGLLDSTAAVDADADGYSAADGDCDDTDATINPGAEELCDDLDNNCDGTVDEGVTSTFYADSDSDGYGSPDSTAEACVAPSGYLEDSSDCDDGDPDTWPGAAERCDKLDNDCDGSVDEDLTEVWYYDGDGDTFGNPDSGYDTCNPPAGWVTDDTDCDDGDSTAWPGAEEVCDEVDNDCDAQIDENVTTTFYADSDADGYGSDTTTVEACTITSGYASVSGDCNDTDGAISPNATELCDGTDNDCDGSIDESDAADAKDWYVDSDSDGYGVTASAKHSCAQPTGYVGVSGDCDDGDNTVNPGATETCNGTDDDCNGWADAADPGLTDGKTFYADADSDGYGSASYTTVDCESPTGYVADNTDCDDTVDYTNPGADERCDGEDNDCDGSTDEDPIDPETFYRDFDGDGYGDATSTLSACDQPTGYVTDDTDCQDSQYAINPGAAEECNSKDDDCDGLIDDDDTAIVGGNTYYEDGDSDGYGNPGVSTDACSQPSGYVLDSTDCDDNDTDRKPGAVESCNGIDDDCDELVDDDDGDVTGQHSWYADTDGDGFGDAADVTVACDQPSGLIPNSSDCDDTDGAIHPGVDERCDEVDNNCDGDIDEGMLGLEADCAADSCLSILEEGSDDGDGLYWLAPDGDLTNARELYCDMTTDDGGWTRLYASLYPTWWSDSDWGDVGDADGDDFSALDLREHFADDDGNWTLRLQVGTVDTWDTSDYDYFTVWTQGHDPIEESSDGSDYTYLDGDEPSTCDGFTGLHSAYYDDGGGYALTSDPDTGDDVDCWGMQLLPLMQYDSSADYPGYLDGYSGGSMHVWQVLWVR